jgi:glyoxylase I family protein
MTSESAIHGIQKLGPIGLSVRDIDRSTKFYVELGFDPKYRANVATSGAHALGARGPEARMVYQRLERDGLAILLVQVEPPVTAAPSSGPPAQLGLSHLEFYVDDIDSAAVNIERLGGSIVEGTRFTRSDLGPNPLHLVYCLDPDGTRLLLVELIASTVGT